MVLDSIFGNVHLMKFNTEDQFPNIASFSLRLHNVIHRSNTFLAIRSTIQCVISICPPKECHNDYIIVTISLSSTQGRSQKTSRAITHS